MVRRRIFAIVPAAGVSARMGVNKLLLPWGRSTVIECVLAAWQASRVDRVTVVARAGDDEVYSRCHAAGADVVATASTTADMKATVRLALEHIERHHRPTEHDAWALAPADMPRLSAAAVDAVLAALDDGPTPIVAPTYRGRRGHPTLFPWRLAQEVACLRADEGINALVAGAAVREIPWPDDSILRDVDTPTEYVATLAGSSRC
jgi:molybdenum cofactor cytidylyltransferase